MKRENQRDAAMRYAALALLFFLTACQHRATSTYERERVAAAAEVTARYEQSKLAPWGVSARAAGDDCEILLVHTEVVMDDSMVEQLHYGVGVYGVTPGGFQQFYRGHAFRGVAYVDLNRHVWADGDLRRREKDAPWEVGQGIERLKPREADMAVLSRLADCP